MSDDKYVMEADEIADVVVAIENKGIEATYAMIRDAFLADAKIHIDVNYDGATLDISEQFLDLARNSKNEKETDNFYASSTIFRKVAYDINRYYRKMESRAAIGF